MTLTKIAVEDLRLGMYVSDLDRPWTETPFLFQGFQICTLEQIEELKRYCKQVYINDEVGGTPLDYRPHSASDYRQTLSFFTEPQKRLEFELLKKTNAPRAKGEGATFHDSATLEEEVTTIAETYEEARALIKTLMEDARLGKSLDIPGAKKAVAQMVDSAIRNPDALVCFAQLKNKDEYIALHSLRVCILVLAFGRHLGLDREQLTIVGIGALLQDVGITKIPDRLLNKPGTLTEQEFALIKRHVPCGVEILAKAKGIPRGVIELAQRHHERFDGSGYTHGLKGSQIGRFGMIGGMVDCYDALTSDRTYHSAMPAHIALRKLYEWRNKAFEGGLVEQFIQCIGIYPIGSVVKLNTGDVGVVITTNRVRRLKPRVTLVLKPDRTPYTSLKTVDLMSQSSSTGGPAEIDQVLEASSHGIEPVAYLPLPALR